MEGDFLCVFGIMFYILDTIFCNPTPPIKKNKNKKQNNPKGAIVRIFTTKWFTMPFQKNVNAGILRTRCTTEKYLKHLLAKI
jgi:hypothetical protein